MENRLQLQLKIGSNCKKEYETYNCSRDIALIDALSYGRAFCIVDKR